MGCELDANGTGPILPGPVEASESGSTKEPEESGSAGDDAPVLVNLDAPVSETDAGTQTDAGPVTGNQDANPNAVSCADGGPPCFVVPDGWLLVALAGERGSPCPADFETGKTVVVEGPILGGACTCNQCDITSTPACDEGEVQIFYGTAAISSGPLAPADCPGESPLGLAITTSPICNPYPSLPSGLVSTVRYVPPAAVGGTCSAPPTLVADGVRYMGEELLCGTTPARSEGCRDRACNAQVESPFAACIEATGDVPCPPGSPLTVRHLLGTAVDFSCSDCGCAVTAECGGTLNFYGDGTCQSPTGTASVDGTCGSVPEAVTNGGSYQYDPAPPGNMACALTGASTASEASLVNPVTVCCAP